MARITNDQGITLDLLPGQNLVTEQAVPWLADDELPAEYSYPIDAPLNDNNKRFVQFGYRPDAAIPRYSLPVMVELEGVAYRRCTFVYRVSGGKLNGYLKIDSAEVYDKIRKLTLLEALPDVISLGDGIVSGTQTTLATRMGQIVNMPPGEFPCTFFPIRNEGFLEDNFDSNKLVGFVRQSFVNVWSSTGFKTDTATQSGFLVVPQFYLSWVLSRIMALAGYQIESDWLADPEVQRLVVVNMTAMNVQTGTSILTNPTLVFGHKVTAGMHLPDMSVSEFLKAIKGRFGLSITFNANSRICYIKQFRKAVQDQTPVDLTQYQNGEYGTEQPDGRGYTVAEALDETDELNKNAKGELLKPNQAVIGIGEQLVQLKCGTCQMAYETSPLTGKGKWFVPTVRQPGNIIDSSYSVSANYLDEKGKRRNPIGLKLLLYRGMTTDSKNQGYPLGTNDVRDGKQQTAGNMALTFTGRYGAWRNELRAYFFFRNNTQKIVQDLLVPVTLLSQMKLHEKVALSLEDYIRRSYLISKLQAESPGIDGKAIVKLEVLTLPSGIDQPADVDDPFVWVAMSQTEVYSEGPVLPPGPARTFQQKAVTLTLTFWTDSGKTTPYAANNLPVNIRVKKTFNPGGEYAPQPAYLETVTTYLASGQSMTLTEELYTQRRRHIQRFDLGPLLVEDYVAAFQLDPGEGYNIIS
ncbi:hypothetical protein [Spirosoma fluminis]